MAKIGSLFFGCGEIATITQKHPAIDVAKATTQYPCMNVIKKTEHFQ